MSTSTKFRPMRPPLFTFRNWIALFTLVSISYCSDEKASGQVDDQRPPNILFIAVDDLRPELNCYGASHIHSPGIDRLASEGFVFNRAYCNIPVCGASRASILSGKRPGRYRFLTYYTRVDEDYPEGISLPKHFKNNGYHTVSNGKVYHHMTDDSLAWNEIWRPKAKAGHSWRDYQTEENVKLDTGHRTRGMPFERAVLADTAYFDGKLTEKTIRDLRHLKETDQPFFMAVGFYKPHLPFNAPAKYWELYDDQNIQLPENYLRPETTPKVAYHNSGELRAYHQIPDQGPVSDSLARQLIHGYYACVSYTDAQIQKLLEALDALGLADNTIVLLWGDHGWNLGDHMLWCKHCNFASSIRTPLILKVPGVTKGQTTNVITEYVDVYPSLCELAGIPIPDHIDGRSFLPLLQGQNPSERFAISKWYDGVTLVKESFHYTEWLDSNQNVRARMLFDHATDPLELNNLAESPTYRGKVAELSKFLRAHWGEDFFEKR